MSKVCILPPLSNSWIILIIRLYTALNRTPDIDCYWVGAVPNPRCTVESGVQGGNSGESDRK